MSIISRRFRRLLRDIVFAQDAGVPVYEDLANARHTLSTIDRLMAEADIERLRMRHEGLPVYVRDESGLIIGLDDKPYKQPTDLLPDSTDSSA